MRKALYRCHRPFIRLEKNTWEPLLAWANNQALLSLLGLVGNISLIIVAATYIGSEKQRRNAEVLNAWQTITNAHGRRGSGGRIQALEFLNASPGAHWRRKFPWVCAPLSICLWEAESLDGIDLSVEDADNIPGQINWTMAPTRYHYGDPITGVHLVKLQLPRASLMSANLEGANLWTANLEGANLWAANLQRANLREANLREANLIAANLAEANLMLSSLEGAHLRDAKLDGGNLYGANLKGTEDLTLEQLSKAKLCQTKIPEGIDLPADRDCEEIAPNLRK